MFADAYSNMGNVYKELGRVEEAIKCYETAIRIQPMFADAYSNLAASYKDSGRPVEAIQFYRHALALKPHLADAFANYVHTLNFICKWDDRDTDFARLSQFLHEQLSQNEIPAVGLQSPAGPGSPGSHSRASLPSYVSPSTGTVVALPSVQPFHALVYPLSMMEMLQIAKRYALRVKLNVALASENVRFTYRLKPNSVRLKGSSLSSSPSRDCLDVLCQWVTSRVILETIPCHT